MKKLILALLLLPVLASSQYSLPIIRNDSVFAWNASTVQFEFVFKTTSQGGITALDVYPVGSVYISINSTNPASLFGGTWVQFGQGKTLIGQDSNDADFDTAEETGGNKSVTLTVGQMPSHTHTQMRLPTATGGTVGFTVDASMSGTPGTTGVSTGSSGNGDAVTILNPYIIVYLFKRTQ